jgi:hypothetical protein
MYNSGEGVLQAYILGHMWAHIAAYNGDKDAKALLQLIADKMSTDQINEV